ncbi:hypothetical protein HOLleu_36101 [Holothuria leucospilota]|uniref:Uncharacterized protein n=1 Tax=Holothuria leucospilota TaxID=206669 RepID=A0A9Q1BGC4_HOLLE|nr:hypothetical protein HOLleu_36101 [Holothuria leucospilota]
MKTTKDGSELSQQQAKHMVLKENSGTVKHLVQALTENLVPFSKHLFNAKWLGLQFRNLTNNIPDDWVVLCLDFGENFNCHYQDEAQSVHWRYNQATVHVVVAYYHCLQLECNLPV